MDQASWNKELIISVVAPTYARLLTKVSEAYRLEGTSPQFDLLELWPTQPLPPFTSLSEAVLDCLLVEYPDVAVLHSPVGKSAAGQWLAIPGATVLLRDHPEYELLLRVCQLEHLAVACVSSQQWTSISSAWQRQQSSPALSGLRAPALLSPCQLRRVLLTPAAGFIRRSCRRICWRQH